MFMATVFQKIKGTISKGTISEDKGNQDKQHQTGDRNLVEVGHKGGPARAYSDLHSILGNRGIKVAHINVNGLISKLTQTEILLKEWTVISTSWQ